jgi:hypothetical protein
MRNTPFRLRAKFNGDDYPPDQCAVVRCTSRPAVDDASKSIWDCRVPLCDRHWTQRCEEENTCPTE